MPQIILSIESDRPEVCEIRNEALQKAGFEVIRAAPGTDVLTLAAEKQPSLILLPVVLPGADGFAICRRLKRDARTATIPILHVSGKSDYPESLESGAEGYLPEDASDEMVARTAGALIQATAGARARTESTRRQMEGIFRAVGESINYGVWLCTPDGRNTYASDSFLKLTGLTQEQCSIFGWGDVLHPDDGEKTLAAWKECVRKQGHWDTEMRFWGVDGDWHPVLVRGAPVRDEQGEITCWAGITLDIGALKRTEESLRESERRERIRVTEMQAVMDAAPAAIFIAHDAECRHISGNRMAYALLRTEPGSNLSKSASEGEVMTRCRFMKDGAEIPPGELPVQKAATTGEPVRNCEVDIGFEDGTPVSLLGDALPMLDENGNTCGAVAVLIDITERKRTEERLQRAQKLESLGLMAGGVAHDFNNLLVGVMGNASLAYNMLPPDHMVSGLMTKVVKASEKAAHLTRQMLAYSGQGSFSVEPVNLSEVVSEMSELVHPSFPKKVTLSVELDTDLPPVQADRGQLHQVFMNLMLNAAEAIGNNRGHVQVRTGVEDVDGNQDSHHPDVTGAELRPGKYVYLEVRDDGCGMDEATKARIFDPFFSTKFAGRGLGLAAVFGILRGHKGAVRVSSKPGEGTCLTVLLPAAQVKAKKGPGLVPAEAPHGSETILLVDDEEMVRDLAKLALERCGYRVLTAASGLAAIEVLKRHAGEIALVVLDLAMPGMSGEEALPELRKIRPGIKVVLSSGYSEGEMMELLQGKGISGFIQKPYTATWLAEQVRQAIG